MSKPSIPGIPNIFGFGGSMTNTDSITRPLLKSQQKSERFSLIDIDGLIGLSMKSVAQRMRSLDAIIMYTPTDGECANLNIANRRYCIYKISDVLEICGGTKGIRFSSDDMRLLMVLLPSIQSQRENLERIYEELKATDTKSTTDPHILELISIFHTAMDSVLVSIVSLQGLAKAKVIELDNLTASGKLR